MLELYRGDISARVRVLATENGVAKVVFDDEVKANFPDDKNTAGTPNLNARVTYIGTRDAFVTELLKRFISYEQ